MPLPDADKKSPRVYTLLQNQDLENVTADTLADVADPIAIEEQNEDELRRVCLVAFARMVTKGSFDGWLTSGGGGNEYNVVLPEDFISASYVRYGIAAYPPYGNSSTSSEAMSSHENYDKVFAYPFIAPESGVVAEMGIDITSASSEANDIQVGIYSSVDTTGAPDTMLGEAAFDSESTGAVYETSLSEEVTLVKGTQYWILWCRSTATIAVTIRVISSLYTPAMCTSDSPNINGNARTIRLSNSDLNLPTSPTLTDFLPLSFSKLSVSLKIT